MKFNWQNTGVSAYQQFFAIDDDNDDRPPLQPIHFQKSLNPKSVEFSGVTLQYGSAKPLFENLNLKFDAGKLIALKGIDGSGRSSFLRAIMRDTPIAKGKIVVGNDNICISDPRFERGSVQYVGQSPTLFRGTILENLTLFGALSAKTALSASKIVGLDEEVVRMPRGYDTLLKSAAGRDVPAPTAQRICIARALATQPSVLILDEANTLLDFAGEQRLTQAFKSLRGKITIIIATHRPSLIRLADQAYDVQAGRVLRLEGEARDSSAIAS